MTTKVRTLYLSSFNMPPVCVSCGAAAGSDKKWKARWGQLEKDKITLSVEFPLCQACAGELEFKRKRSAKFVYLLFVLLSLYLCLLTSTGINGAVGGKGVLGVAAGLVVLVLVVLLGSWLSDLIDTAGFTPEQKKEWHQKKKARAKKTKMLGRSVRIVKVRLPDLFGKSNSGSIDFEFENLIFAREFAAMNLGQIVLK
jgi:hypothetical protein